MVAFQTILVTLITSAKLTTPTNKAINAPIQADHPIDKFLGCTMTKNNVTKNMISANIASTLILHKKSSSYNATGFFQLFA